MARRSKSKPASKSALAQREEADARRLKEEVPFFSREGLTVHKTRYGMLAGAFVALLLVGAVFVPALTGASNFDVAATSSLGITKAGSSVSFEVTIRNTAAFSAYAYETHVVGLPSGWSVLRGEDIFGLKAGLFRTLQIEISTGGGAPPNRDYPFFLKVVSKTPDGKTPLSTKAIPLTVKVLSSSIALTVNPQPAIHNYTAPGTYLATLTVTDNAGASNSTAREPVRLLVNALFPPLTPNEKPYAALALVSPSSNVAPGSTLTWSALSSRPSWNTALQNTSWSIANYTMDFGDGSPPLSHSPLDFASLWDGTFNHTYPTEGRFLANLTVTTNVSTSDSTFWSVLVRPNSPAAPAASNRAPFVSGLADRSFANPGDPVTFYARAIDLDGSIASMSWNFGDGSPELSLPPSAPVPAVSLNPTSATATARLRLTLANGEGRDLPLVLSLPDPASNWETVPNIANTPVPVLSSNFSSFDFDLHIPKTTLPGLTPLRLQACIQTNPNDCITANLTVDVPAFEFFVVKTYVEPAVQKEVYQGRSIDILLYLENKGNLNTTVVPDPLTPPNGISTFFWRGTPTPPANASASFPPIPILSAATAPNLTSTIALLVLRATALPDAPVGPASPILQLRFSNPNHTVIQSLVLFLTVRQNTSDLVLSPIAPGNRLNADYTGATAEGLLVDTNQFGLFPLIESNQRPTHPEYSKPESPTTYDFTLAEPQNYTGIPHKGFEAYLAGYFEHETVVFWLTPDQTKLPPNAFLFSNTLVFEVRIAAVLPR